MKKKNLLVTTTAVALALSMAFGGTMAYLTQSTEEVENNFATNQNAVELNETTEGYDIVPGTYQEKNPTIVATYTLDSYVYVEVTDNTQGLVTYEIAEGWKLLGSYENKDGVTISIYYQLMVYDEAKANEGVCTYSLEVLKDNQVSYSAAITNKDMKDVEDVSLTFKAYIAQANITGETNSENESAEAVFATLGLESENALLVGGVFYNSLADAIEAAEGDAEIYVTNDVTVDEAITINEVGVTLVLGSNTITSKLEEDWVFSLENGAGLTIEATSGGISANGDYSCDGLIALTGGGNSLTLEGGTYEFNTADGALIKVFKDEDEIIDNVAITLNDVTVVTNNSVVNSETCDSSSGITLIVTGGSYTCTGESEATTPMFLIRANKSTVEFEDVTASSTSHCIFAFDGSGPDSTATINDCTFTLTGDQLEYAYLSTAVATSNGNTINITGSTVIKSSVYGIMVWSSGGTINVDLNEDGMIRGDKYAAEADSTYENAKAVINIKAGYIDGNLKTVATQGSASIVVTGGTFTVDPKAYVNGYSIIEKNGVYTIGEEIG